MEGLDVRMSGVVCRHGRVEAVPDVDLDIVRGQRVALNGTNGSGCSPSSGPCCGADTIAA
ncbi:hypothetical protein [Streptomyces sp. OP7]|uniref:hypothetical protein n=1 Tax=Streptomyces sp. OP7 TaxID=3142462 RepID=UPI0032E8E7D5